ncbi:MAG: response regulator [Candidatus Omnitrophota bacterium]|jgi:PAS domain S-box-containing protein|nr:MAG: response regulator [Candidatus Omnitrophota bacterium]
MASERFLQSIEEALQKGERDKARLMIGRLELAQHCYSALLQQVKDAVLIFQPQTGKILEFNAQALEIFAYSENDLPDMSIESLFSRDETETAESDYRRICSDEKFIGKAIPFLRGDGNRIFIDVTTTRIQLDQETVIQGIFRDVTERVSMLREAELHAKELEEKNAKLEEAQQLRSAFLATISHELRTPLNAIIGYNSLLEDGIYGLLNEKQHKAVHRIDRNAIRLLNLINQLLQLSRLEAGASAVFNEKTDIVPLIKDILNDYQSMAEEKGLTLSLSHPHPGVTVVTDESKLQEMIRQLVSNAVKFTNQGSITVDIQKDHDFCTVKVADSGPGIKPEQRDEIFELFRQADASFTRRHEGAGLGLAIVRRLADLLKIRVELESEPQKGSQFKFIIPLSEKLTEIQPRSDILSPSSINRSLSEETESAESEEKPKTALVVDDDPYTVELLSEYLETQGQFRVSKAFTGMHAMIHLAQNPPDLLLVDLLMPHINGERVIRYCRELWGADTVHIVVITGKYLDPDELRDLKTKVDAVILKGELRPQTLSVALQKIIPLPVHAQAAS